MVRTKQQQTGTRGEKIAWDYLRSLGYKMYESNVRIGRDEIDIICFDPDDKVLVFAEVKARSSVSDHYSAWSNLTTSKRAKLRRSARQWVQQKEHLGSYRIDLVLVEAGKISDHIREIDW